jgi:site-specific DNA-cytosine methylase
VKAIDLFSGPGGMTLGMKQVGWEPIASVEKRRDAVDTYSAHTPEPDHYCDDIRNVSFSKYRGKADLVFGGPPCQPFSTRGLRRGTSDTRNMMPAYISVIEEVQPRAFLIENVPGLVTKARIGYLTEVLRDLSNLGYRLSALIQSFPKNMEFSGKISSQYTQIGDAVPPLLAKALGSALIEQLNGEVIDEENYTTSEFRLPLFERIK